MWRTSLIQGAFGQASARQLLSGNCDIATVVVEELQVASFPLAKLLGFVAESLLPRRRGQVSYGHQPVGETKTSPFLRLSLIFFVLFAFLVTLHS